MISQTCVRVVKTLVDWMNLYLAKGAGFLFGRSYSYNVFVKLIAKGVATCDGRSASALSYKEGMEGFPDRVSLSSQIVKGSIRVDNSEWERCQSQ